MDFLYTANSKYLDLMLASIYSLIINSGIDNIRLHLILADFSKEDYKKIEQLLYKFSNVEFYFYDINDYNISKFNIPNWRESQIANARLFFQEFLLINHPSIENLLYLDSDTIVVSNISDLSEYKDNTISASKDICLKTYVRELEVEKYYNSGVLLFNVPSWVNSNCEDKIIHFIEKNNKPLQYPDQDILNCALEGEIADLPFKYNLDSSGYLFDMFTLGLYYNNFIRQYSKDEFIDAKNDARILHSVGFRGIKPWTNNNVNAFNSEYMKYLMLVNPEFQREDLNGIQRVFAMYQILLKYRIVLSSYVPEKNKKIIRGKNI